MINLFLRTRNRIEKNTFLKRLHVSLLSTKGACAHWAYVYTPPIWYLTTFGEHQTPLFNYGCFISRFEPMRSENNLMRDQGSINLKTDLATATAVPAKTCKLPSPPLPKSPSQSGTRSLIPQYEMKSRGISRLTNGSGEQLRQMHRLFI